MCVWVFVCVSAHAISSTVTANLYVIYLLTSDVINTHEELLKTELVCYKTSTCPAMIPCFTHFNKSSYTLSDWFDNLFWQMTHQVVVYQTSCWSSYRETINKSEQRLNFKNCSHFFWYLGFLSPSPLKQQKKYLETEILSWNIHGSGGLLSDQQWFV